MRISTMYVQTVFKAWDWVRLPGRVCRNRRKESQGQSPMTHLCLQVGKKMSQERKLRWNLSAARVMSGTTWSKEEAVVNRVKSCKG